MMTSRALRVAALGAVLALVPSLAFAGAGTITTKDAAGATQTFTVVTDGAAHFLASTVLCDGVAGANCVSVKAASTATAQTDLALVVRNPDLVTGLADSACATDNGTCTIGQLIKRTNQNLTTLNTSVGAAVPAGTARIGYVSDDPCTQLTKTNLAIASSTGTTQLVAPSGSTQVYVCSFSLIAASTAVINLVGGTGATCTTGTPVAAIGSTTAASGMSLAANGGLTFGNGGATVVRTTTAGHGLCLIQSGTTALAGNIEYVQQ